MTKIMSFLSNLIKNTYLPYSFFKKKDDQIEIKHKNVCGFIMGMGRISIGINIVGTILLKKWQTLVE